MSFSISVHSQNDLKAKTEFESAEIAFNDEKFEEAFNRVSKAEEFIGKWTPKTGYLKIMALDKLCDYFDIKNSYTQNQIKAVKTYMSFANKDESNVSQDKFKTVYAIEEKLNYIERKSKEEEMPELIKAWALYQEKKYEEAIIWCLKAAEKNNSIAMCLIGIIYYNGYGIDQDYNQSMVWFRKSADQGNIDSFKWIGRQYYSGQGVVKDNNEFIKWQQKILDRGDKNAFLEIANVYYEEKKFSDALNYFKKAAEFGEVNAMRVIGFIYENGNGTAKDDKEAIKWFLKAAEKGDVFSMEEMVKIYVGKNDQKLYVWLTPAAEKGSLYCMSLLAQFYKYGTVLEKNYDKAFYWAKKAAEAGNVDAMATLSSCYFDGLGVEKDRKLAEVWFEKYRALSPEKFGKK